MSGIAEAGHAYASAERDVGEFPEIGRLLQAIDRWNVSSEAVYLGVGEDIQALHRKVSTVRDAIGRSTDIFAGQEMTDMRNGLSAAADETRRVAELAAERADALTRLQAAVEIAGSGATAVLLVFRLLDYVVLIARAQVQGMSEGQEELGPFTAHVDDLVSVGEQVAHGIDDRMKMLDDALSESRLIEGRVDIGGDGMIEDFMALACRLTDQQEASAAAQATAHAAFTNIWRAIGGVVAGLQFHDMARQRLEHTIANLGLMQEVLASGHITRGGIPLPAALRPAAVRRIALLETAQLTDLTRVYEAKMEELDEHLARIGAELEDSVAVLARLPGGTSRGASSLDKEADRLGAHFRRGAHMRLSLGTSLDKCIETTGRLLEMTGRLDDLEHELKIAGVNAAVRAAHVRGGDETIGYIARVICEQATIARTEADRVRRGVELAVHETRELAAHILPAVAAAEAAIEARLTGATAALKRAEEVYAAELGTATAVSRSLPAEVATVRERMTPHLEGCRLMDALSAAIAAIAASLDDAAEPDAEAFAELDAELAGHYTMVEERAVFAAVIGSAGSGSASPLPEGDVPETAGAPAPGSDEDLDDILF